MFGFKFCGFALLSALKCAALTGHLQLHLPWSVQSMASFLSQWEGMGSQTTKNHRAHALFVTCSLLSIYLIKARRDFQLISDYLVEGGRKRKQSLLPSPPWLSTNAKTEAATQRAEET